MAIVINSPFVVNMLMVNCVYIVLFAFIKHRFNNGSRKGQYYSCVINNNMR